MERDIKIVEKKKCSWVVCMSEFRERDAVAGIVIQSASLRIPLLRWHGWFLCGLYA